MDIFSRFDVFKTAFFMQGVFYFALMNFLPLCLDAKWTKIKAVCSF